MARNNRKKWFNLIPLTTLNCLIASSFLVVSTYLDYTRPTASCAFCLTLRLLLLMLVGLSSGALFAPAQRRFIYPAQLAVSMTGLLLSMRQLYFEKMVRRFVSCPRMGSNMLETVFKWLSQGAPACKKTHFIGFFSFSVWACIAFAILSFIAFQIYYKRLGRR